jgi:signal recognition particle receptor subunit beta
MVLFNYSTKELTAKVVYYGPGLCGKTTNLHWIHEKVPIKNKGKMLSLATETDRTLFFDFLPIELGLIRGMKTRIQLYTVPGQVFYNATRRMVLKGADAVVFVADSQEAMIDANIESMDNLRQNLEANEIDPDAIPTVMQFNKRDLPNALPIEILNEKLNERELAHFEAVAVKGVGVEETLKAVTGLVFRSLAGKYGSHEDAKSATPAEPIRRPTLPESPLSLGRPDTAPRVDKTVAAIPPAARADPPSLSAPASSFRPLNIGPQPGSSEELLDSLELEASPEADDGLFADELDVEEIAFDEPPPAAPQRAPTSPPADRGAGGSIRGRSDQPDGRRHGRHHSALGGGRSGNLPGQRPHSTDPQGAATALSAGRTRKRAASP